MYGVMAVLAMVMGLLAGAAKAGDAEVMAMRGNPPDGTRPVNMVSRVIPGGVGEMGTHTPAIAAASRVEEPKGSVRECPERFFPWRNNCSRTPGIVAGQRTDMAPPAGFGFTPRFVERPDEQARKGFFTALLKELASD